MSRRIAREKALQALFQIDLAKSEIIDAVEYVIEDSKLSIEAKRFARELVYGTVEHREECDRYISKYAKEWQLDRLVNVDRNILRLAIFEIMYRDEIPFKVSINEAIELAKIFSGEQSGKFVNGLLDFFGKDMGIDKE